MLEQIMQTPFRKQYGWRRANMLEHLPRLCYSGPLGPRRNWNQWDHRFCGYGESAIYHLFDVDGNVLYIGKAWCPLYRFEKHQRRDWWPQVDYLNLYKVTCGSHPTEPCGDLTGVTLSWELRAIEMIRPAHNIAGIPKEVS